MNDEKLTFDFTTANLFINYYCTDVNFIPDFEIRI